MLSPFSFRFNSGRLSLDLAATVRRRPSAPNDLLLARGTAVRWLKEARVIQRLLSLSTQQEGKLRQLREAIYASASSLAEGLSLPVMDVETINRIAAYPVPVLRLDPSTMELEWSAEDPFAAALSLIARDALDLIAGPQAPLIRACAQEDCGMIIVETCTCMRRRWCSMDRCGSRAKGTAFRRKHTENAHDHVG